MDVPGTGGRRIGERLVEIAGESLLAPRQGGEAEALAFRLAGRGVDADEGETEIADAPAHLDGRNLRHRAFDTRKARLLGRSEAIRERQFQIEKAQMGGEAKHEAPFVKFGVSYRSG